MLGRRIPVLVAMLLIGSALAATTVERSVPGDRVRLAAASESFRAGTPYVGTFPDPEIVKYGRIWVAYATTVGSRTLPVMTSPDLRTWWPRKAHASGKWWDNDGMPAHLAAKWAGRKKTGAMTFVPSWAPSAGRLPNGTWLVAYAPPLGQSAKRCIAVASAADPQGPFRDVTKVPIVCPKDQGAIDPYVYVAGQRAWLLWKTEGVVGRAPTRIWGRELDVDLKPDGAVRWRAGSVSRVLLQTARAWEGTLIENPALFAHQGRLYLFYSANQWVSDKYAIGYAVCRSPQGPCVRPKNPRPLLATGGGLAGPGGPAPTTGPAGELVMGYAAFRAGAVGGGQARRMYLARLGVGSGGALYVANRNWKPPSH